MPEPTHNDGTQMYRLYNADGTLLYVGISWSALSRITQHKTDKPWWTTVTRVDITTIPGDRAAAEAAERHAIHTEQPLHNVIHRAQPKAAHTQAPSHWTCQNCPKPAIYLQYNHKTGEWSCVCKKHDPHPAGQDGNTYWIDTNRITTIDDLDRWTEHLNHKRWFNRSDWQHIIKRCFNVKNPSSRKELPPPCPHCDQLP